MQGKRAKRRTVADLIEQLSRFPPDTECVTPTNWGWCPTYAVARPNGAVAVMGVLVDFSKEDEE